MWQPIVYGPVVRRVKELDPLRGGNFILADVVDVINALATNKAVSFAAVALPRRVADGSDIDKLDA